MVEKVIFSQEKSVKSFKSDAKIRRTQNRPLSCKETYLYTQPDNCTMDLYNNALGRAIALTYKGECYEEIAEIIYQKVKDGTAYVLFPDEGN